MFFTKKIRLYRSDVAIHARTVYLVFLKMPFLFIRKKGELISTFLMAVIWEVLQSVLSSSIVWIRTGLWLNQNVLSEKANAVLSSPEGQYMLERFQHVCFQICLSAYLKLRLFTLSSLEQAYVNHIEELYRSDVYKEKAMQYMLERFQHVWSFSNMPFSVFDEKEILVQGELISTFLMACYLEEQGVEVVLLPALNFMRITVDNEPDMEYISKHLKVLLEQNKEAEIYITQGFICRNAYGSIDNLERGGSDYTASLIGAAIQAEEIQIWTDIDGMHNNDPRFVNDTAPVRQLNFDEAAKLAHFGAKILHPACILPAKEKNIPVRLLNALQPSASGTLISNTAEKEAIKAIAAKDNITYVKIKSLHTIPTPHFLSIVFDTFYNYNTPVDMVTTSDIGVSVAIDNDKHIDEIVGVLREYAQ